MTYVHVTLYDGLYTPVYRSFGVLLWEVMGRGGFPYQDLSDGEVVGAVCHSRLPLVKPAECPDTV